MPESNAVSNNKIEMFYVPLVCLFQSIVLMTNVIGAKVIQLGMILQPVGCFVFPLTYSIGGLITEIYGVKRARGAIYFTLFVNLLFVLMSQLAIWLPAAPHWEGQAAYEAVLGGSIQITCASLLSFLFGELINSNLISALKKRWHAKWFGTRVLVSTSLAEACGTSIMIGVGFWGQLPLHDLMLLAFHYYLFKMLVFSFTVPVMKRCAVYLNGLMVN